MVRGAGGARQGPQRLSAAIVLTETLTDVPYGSLEAINDRNFSFKFHMIQFVHHN
jgi:hypothetical protein